jgi:eukaryotic-like serine/threonine-protein kinase
LRGFYYLYNGNWQKCVEEYNELVTRYPSDNIGHNNLATCYSQLRDWPKAIEQAREDVKIHPEAAGLGNLALFSSYGSDFQGGEREARRLQQMIPSFEYGYLSLAFAQIGQGQLEQAAESYRQMAKVSSLGASMAASGLADLAAYEGHFTEAGTILQQGISADVAAKAEDSAADKLTALAQIQLLRGQRKEGLAAIQKALNSSQATKIRFLAARVFVDTGDFDKAQRLAAGLSSEILAEPQAYGKIIEAEIKLKQGDRNQAIQMLADANKILDTWIGRFELGRAYVEAGAFAEATSEFDRCQNRRGETLALFLDEVPTSAYFPPLYFFRGRAEEGLGSGAAAASYDQFLAIQGKGDASPQVQEAKKRLAALRKS